MKPKRFPPDDPREWIGRARSNLVHATQDEASAVYSGRIFVSTPSRRRRKPSKRYLFIAANVFPYIHELDELCWTLIAVQRR